MPFLPDIQILDQIYRLYSKYTNNIAVSCRKFCADCCTGNVTLTRLEGEYLLRRLSEDNRSGLIESLLNRRDRHRYRPTVSTNGFVRQCAGEEAPSEEENLPEWGCCPLLLENACPVYTGRPFGCRSMMSLRSCREFGQAEIDPFTMTVNTVFMQFIEHIDAGGFFGNLTDVLLKLSLSPGHDTNDLVTVANKPIPVLMVPPEHHRDITPLVNDLQRILTDTAQSKNT